jgi:hypothetical protein
MTFGIWSGVFRLWAKNRERLLQFTRQFYGSVEVLTKLRHFYFPHKDPAAMQRLLLTIAIFFSLPLKRRGEVRCQFLGSVCQQMTPPSKAHERNTMIFSTFLKTSINDQSAVDLSPHPSFTSLLPPPHKLTQHESAPAYKQCETFGHNHTK